MSLNGIFCSFFKSIIHRKGPTYKYDRFIDADNFFFEFFSLFWYQPINTIYLIYLNIYIIKIWYSFRKCYTLKIYNASHRAYAQPSTEENTLYASLKKEYHNFFCDREIFNAHALTLLGARLIPYKGETLYLVHSANQ